MNTMMKLEFEFNVGKKREQKSSIAFMCVCVCARCVQNLIFKINRNCICIIYGLSNVDFEYDDLKIRMITIVKLAVLKYL